MKLLIDEKSIKDKPYKVIYNCVDCYYEVTIERKHNRQNNNRGKSLNRVYLNEANQINEKAFNKLTK